MHPERWGKTVTLSSSREIDPIRSNGGADVKTIRPVSCRQVAESIQINGVADEKTIQ